MYKNTNEIRNMFLNFFLKKKHIIIPGSPLILKNDHSILFTNAGMNQFKNIFLGNKIPKYSKVTSIQNCLRTGGKHNDLEKVGYTNKHHTFFEMLGNFSFGNYFKKKAIIFAWELLTSKKWFNLDKDKIWITIYNKDYESYEIWNQIIGIPKNKIIKIKDKIKKPYSSDNFWKMGNIGPCGPCTEIYYNFGKTINKNNNFNILKNDKFIEIWNIVFMEFNQNIHGKLKKLPILSVDTGMGLERIASIIQKVYSNYEIDTFKLIKSQIYKILKITKQKDNIIPINIITDHIRAIVFIILENIIPSNEKHGYILRKIIRRASRFGYKIGKKKPFLYKLIPTLLNFINTNIIINDIKKKKIQKIIKKEEIKFNKTLKQGLQIVKYEIQNTKNKILSGDKIFYLYDTFGFPIELTNEICLENNIKFDYIGFKKEKKKNKNKIQKKKYFYQKKINLSINKKTIFLGYKKIHLNKCKIIKILINNISKKKYIKKKNGIIILNKTPFYHESGGQIGDSGILYSKNGLFKVYQTKKYNKTIIHIGKLIYGKFKIKDIIFATINFKKRKKIQNNHTSIHLLNTALNIILKKKILQTGSFVNDKYLRFDFNNKKKLNIQQIHQIEKLINTIITNNIKITTKIMNFKKAKKQGAISLSNYIYTKKVRVIFIKTFSIELCKGTHTKYTGNIGIFKIISESSISSGIRRIEAKTSKEAILEIHKENTNIFLTTSLFNTNKYNLIKKIIQYKKNINTLKKKYINIQTQNIKYEIKKLKKKTILVNDIIILITKINYKNYKSLRNIVDILKKKLKPKTIIILYSKNKKKYIIIVGVSETIINIINSKIILNKIIKKNNGKGGGKKELAEGYITNKKNYKKIFKKTKKWLISIIKNK